jgi:hypothetical protein
MVLGVKNSKRLTDNLRQHEATVRPGLLARLKARRAFFHKLDEINQLLD